MQIELLTFILRHIHVFSTRVYVQYDLIQNKDQVLDVICVGRSSEENNGNID